MKEQDVMETAMHLRNEIAKAQKITSDTDIHTIFLSAEFIVSCLSYLIAPIADMEQKYRIQIVKVMESGSSNAAAEAKAKSTDQYKEWRKYAALYELGHEQIMLLKKFREDLQREMMRS